MADNNNHLFGIGVLDNAVSGVGNALGGLATSVGKAKDDMAKAVEKAEFDAKASGLIKSLDDPIITHRTRLRLIKQMDKLCERRELSDETKGLVLEKMKEAEQRIDVNELTRNEKDEFHARMRKVGRPIEISLEEPRQSFDEFSRTTSLSGSSSNRSTDTKETTNTQESGDSRVSTAGVVKQLGKEPGDNGPLASSPKANEGEQKENKKAPTKTPGCLTGIRKAFSSCYSCLSNGLRSAYDSYTDKNMQKYVNLDGKNLYRNEKQVHKTTSTRARGSDNANRTNARVTDQKNGGFFASIREFMSKKREMDIHEVRFDARHGFSSQYSSTVGLGSLNNAGKAVIGGVGKAGKASVNGVEKIVRGMGEVGATGLSGAKFMTTGWSGRNKESWGDWVNGLRASTRGMQGPTVGESVKAVAGAGTFLAGAGVATVVAVPGAIKAITPGRRAVSFAAAAAGAGLGAAGSMVKKMGEIRTSAYFPSAFR